MQDAGIQREFRDFGLILQRDALIFLRNYVNQSPDPESTLQEILQRLCSVMQDSLVQKSTVEEAIQAIRTSASPTHHVFGFQQAFEIPKFAFDSSERTLVRAAKPASLLGSASDKLAVFHERYQIVRTCLLHTHLFQGSALQFGLGSTHSFSLTTVASLLSLGEGAVILLGFLDINGDDLTLEDPSGAVALDVSGASAANGIFPVGCIALVQGAYRDGRVFGTLIGHPPATALAAFDTHFWKLSTDPFGWDLTKAAIAELDAMRAGEHQGALVLVVSDVWLDVPAVVDNFNFLLSQYDKAPPNILVIAGAFASRPMSFAQWGDFRRYFGKFAEIVKGHSTIMEHSKVVIVPALHDIGAPRVFPRPAFPPSLAGMLPGVHFMSNPCRLRFLSQTIVVFRDDLLKRLSSAAVMPVPDREAHKNMLTTIIDQRHLCPLDLEHAPVCWPYDHAMRLFPQPAALAVCDSAPAWSERYADCCAFNPGQFGNGGTYAQYFPAEKRAVIRAIG
jgi:DNA polymerase epsilon subunit 2